MISFLLGAPSYLYFNLVRNLPLSGITDYAYTQYSGMVTLAFILLIEGHQLKSKWLENSRAWKVNFRRRLFLELTIAVIYPIPIVVGSYSFLYLVIWKTTLFLPSIIMYCGYVIFISLFFMVFVNINYIIEDWRNSILKNENLEKENIKAKLEALQTQLSPHFLFNNFNIIDALIETNPDLARKYIQGLSTVFRYILDNKNRELVTLESELHFIKEFMFLMETRFDKNILLRIVLPKECLRLYIPPVSLQLIIENAIKHNEISSRNQLTIAIESKEQDYLTVSNNIKVKKGISKGTGTGLNNISERYRYLTSKEIMVNHDKNNYQISIPLLKVSNKSD